jgi:hypothetical protein
MKVGRIFLVILALSLITVGVAAAATDTKTLTINFNPAARAKLTLGAASITFPDADPDTSPTVTGGPVTVTSSVRTGSTAKPSLTVLCTDLKSGSDSITIDNVSWTATGDGYQPGTMNSATAQTAGSWTGSNSYNGSFTYSLVNKWTYATGSYSATATYTLTAP